MGAHRSLPGDGLDLQHRKKVTTNILCFRRYLEILPEVERQQNESLRRVHDVRLAFDLIPRSNHRLNSLLVGSVFREITSTVRLEGSKMTIEDIISLLGYYLHI